MTDPKRPSEARDEYDPYWGTGCERPVSPEARCGTEERTPSEQARERDERLGPVDAEEQQ